MQGYEYEERHVFNVPPAVSARFGVVAPPACASLRATGLLSAYIMRKCMLPLAKRFRCHHCRGAVTTFIHHAGFWTHVPPPHGPLVLDDAYAVCKNAHCELAVREDRCRMAKALGFEARIDSKPDGGGTSKFRLDLSCSMCAPLLLGSIKSIRAPSLSRDRAPGLVFRLVVFIFVRLYFTLRRTDISLCSSVFCILCCLIFVVTVLRGLSAFV